MEKCLTMPCYCGAIDCPSCGPAQGYTVHRIRNNRGDYVWVNPEDEEDEPDIDCDDGCDDEPDIGGAE